MISGWGPAAGMGSIGIPPGRRQDTITPVGGEDPQQIDPEAHAGRLPVRIAAESTERRTPMPDCIGQGEAACEPGPYPEYRSGAHTRSSPVSGSGW